MVPVVPLCGPIVDRLVDQVVDSCLCLDVVQLREESFLHLLHDRSLKAGQVVVAQDHHLEEEEQLVSVLSKVVEQRDDRLSELEEQEGSGPVQQLDEVPRQLEGRRLELDVPGGLAEDEAEVDVDDVPF